MIQLTASYPRALPQTVKKAGISVVAKVATKD